jgi:hypothetical protein
VLRDRREKPDPGGVREISTALTPLAGISRSRRLPPRERRRRAEQVIVESGDATL